MALCDVVAADRDCPFLRAMTEAAPLPAPKELAALPPNQAGNLLTDAHLVIWLRYQDTMRCWAIRDEKRAFRPGYTMEYIRLRTASTQKLMAGADEQWFQYALRDKRFVRCSLFRVGVNKTAECTLCNTRITWHSVREGRDHLKGVRHRRQYDELMRRRHYDYEHDQRHEAGDFFETEDDVYRRWMEEQRREEEQGEGREAVQDSYDDTDLEEEEEEAGASQVPIDLAGANQATAPPPPPKRRAEELKKMGPKRKQARVDDPPFVITIECMMRVQKRSIRVQTSMDRQVCRQLIYEAIGLRDTEKIKRIEDSEGVVIAWPQYFVRGGHYVVLLES